MQCILPFSFMLYKVHFKIYPGDISFTGRIAKIHHCLLHGSYVHLYFVLFRTAAELRKRPRIECWWLHETLRGHESERTHRLCFSSDSEPKRRHRRRPWWCFLEPHCHSSAFHINSGPGKRLSGLAGPLSIMQARRCCLLRDSPEPQVSGRLQFCAHRPAYKQTGPQATASTELPSPTGLHLPTISSKVKRNKFQRESRAVNQAQLSRERGAAVRRLKIAGLPLGSWVRQDSRVPANYNIPGHVCRTAPQALQVDVSGELEQTGWPRPDATLGSGRYKNGQPPLSFCCPVPSG